MDLAQSHLSDEAVTDHPERLIEVTQSESYARPWQEQAELQLKAVQTRFAQLVDTLPVLRQLADEQGLSQIRQIDDLAMLLLPHPALKSYPMSYLEESRFDLLTQWIDGFTTHDLSGLDASRCDSIDDWLMLVDRETPLRPIHSTGTSGKLSFLPRSEVEMPSMVNGYRRQFDRFGDERPLLSCVVEDAPYVYLQYRTGGMAQHRLIESLQKHLFGGDRSMVMTLYPGRFSADAASIGGRIRAAEARGDLGALKISPKLFERRDAFLREHEQASAHADAFFAAAARWRGKPVSVQGHPPVLYAASVEAAKRGIQNLFSPESFVGFGGGMKGLTLPPDWDAKVRDFLGGQPLVQGYGMTEMIFMQRACPCGNYHIPTWQVPFLLDPRTGAVLPRTGVRTGRYGALDLNAQTYWAGVLTGDEVIINWGDENPCACGRLGPFMDPEIRRYSEKEGGDDKITCAGAPEAHDKAIDFILNSIAG